MRSGVLLMRRWLWQVVADSRRQAMSVQSCNATLITLVLPQIPGPINFLQGIFQPQAQAQAHWRRTVVGVSRR